MTQRTVLVVLPLVLASIVPSSAADWPQWRGPKRDGCSADVNLLDRWPAGGPRLMWKTSGLGTGYSSVAVADGRIITLGDLKDASYIIALDLAGKGLWTAKVGKTGGNYAGTRSTPTIDGELVYGLGQFGDLVCVEAKGGKERWRHNLDSEFQGNVGGWNYSESPLVDGDRLVCAPGGRRGTVLALDKKSGQRLWQTKEYTDHAEYTSIVAATIAGKKQYVHLSGGTLAGIEPESGAVLWRTDRRGETATIPTPIVDGDRIYVTSGYGVGCNLFEVVRQDGTFKVREVYKSKDMVNHHGGVVKVGDHLYGYSDGKGWVCQEFATGETVWREKSRLGKGSIAYADGKLFLRDEGGKGTVVLIEATPKGWSELGRFDQPNRSNENSWAHPAISDGRLYLRDMDVLLAYEVGGKGAKESRPRDTPFLPRRRRGTMRRMQSGARDPNVFTIAGVQMDVAIGQKEKNLARMAEALNEAMGAGARLVVFPECALTGYCFESKAEAMPHAEAIPGPATHHLAELCSEHGCFAVFGLIERAGDDLFNACALVGPEGLLGSYRKVHLPYLGLDMFTTPGDRGFQVHTAGPARIGMSICYDGSFPEAARSLALDGADIICLPTNWPPGSECTASFVINTRALENNVYYVAVNRVGTERGFRFIGGSRICHPGGRTLAEAAHENEAIIHAEVDLAVARDKHLVRVPGKHEIDRFKDRRPEMYGRICEPRTGDTSCGQG